MNTVNLNVLRNSVREKSPLIHSITNPISINQCANAVLCVGARPIMAEHPDEVEAITKSSDALMLNLGNITDARMKSMIISAGTANKNNIPFVVDLVGIACSSLRRRYAYDLLNRYTPAAVKGNYSEITALMDISYTSCGVDGDLSIGTDEISKKAVMLARKYNTIVLASGKTDVVTDGERLFYIRNGTAQLSTVTGTGCMLGALCAAYLSAANDISAILTSCVVLGISGQMAETDKGSGTFMVNLMDNLTTVTDSDIEKYINMEEITIEAL